MMICHGRNLCQMCDTDDLMLSADQRHLLRHFLCCSSTYPHIDLIKNQRRNLIPVSHNTFDHKHNSGQLSTGGYFHKRTHRLSRIQRNHKLYVIRTICRIRTRLFKCNRKFHIFKIQICKTFCNRLFHNLRLLFSDLRQLLCHFLKLLLFLFQISL